MSKDVSCENPIYVLVQYILMCFFTCSCVKVGTLSLTSMRFTMTVPVPVSPPGAP